MSAAVRLREARGRARQYARMAGRLYVRREALGDGDGRGGGVV